MTIPPRLLLVDRVVLAQFIPWLKPSIAAGARPGRFGDLSCIALGVGAPAGTEVDDLSEFTDHVRFFGHGESSLARTVHQVVEFVPIGGKHDVGRLDRHKIIVAVAHRSDRLANFDYWHS